MKSISSELTTFRNELEEVKCENKALKEDNISLHDHINRLEAHSRRQNLVFRNIPENDDTVDLSTKITTIFTSMNIKDSSKIIIDVIHRNKAYDKSKPRSVTIRFLKRSDRNKVWEARRRTPAPLILNEDLPEAYKKTRGYLMPVLKAAQAAGLKSTLVMDKVKVDGKLYSCDQLDKLPVSCDLTRGCQKQNDKVVSFFGRYSPFSNFYKCNFTVNNIKYNCGEQFIQHKCCEILGQEVQAQKILLTDDPSQQKRLAKLIRTDHTPWYDVARAEILPGIRAKFSQNPDLAALLVKTGTRDIGEASIDPFWGVGFSLSNNDVLKSDLWSGKNIMGKVLLAVRAELVAKQ